MADKEAAETKDTPAESAEKPIAKSKAKPKAKK
jgi:hypothetical protein